MEKYNVLFNTKSTPQSEPIPGREKSMKKNHAGGFAFRIDKWSRLTRFLILGSSKNTYYQKAKDLTKENASTVISCIGEDPKRVVDEIVRVSDQALAPKNDQALFALALVATQAKDSQGRRYAFEKLPKVARIGTHVLNFVAYMSDLGGWGRLKREGVGNWYTSKDLDSLAFQLAKYQSRDGWSHADVIRLTHPKPSDEKMAKLFRWARWGVGEKALTLKSGYKGDRSVSLEELPTIVQAMEAVKGQTDPKQVAKMVETFGLTREMVPSESLNHPVVWEALFPRMGMTALIRNLGKLSNIGLIKPMSDFSGKVCEKLTNGEAIQKARVHPFQVLMALKTYLLGRGIKGSLRWDADQRVADALEEAFYLAFKNVEPSGKKILLGIDVSGSMDCSWGGANEIAGIPGFTARQAAACMSMVTVRAEPIYHTLGFSHELRKINLTKKDSMDSVISKMQQIPMGGTDCALPMIWAAKNKVEVDVFHVYTDNETWFGNIHPTQALREYRQKMGRPAKLCVVAFTPTDFSIADPEDSGMLDFVGFDSSAPQVMANFAKEGI